jgi:hypothetical protein
MNYKINCHNRYAGFFSDLVHGILPSVIYLSDNKLQNFNVDWRSYFYSATEFNLFDYFFDCNKNFENYDEILGLSNCPYGIFFEFNNTHEKLLRGSEVIKEIKLLESDFIKNIKMPFSNEQNILGVQHRKTDHSDVVRILSNEEIIKKIEYEFIKNSYDKIFLITDDESSLNDFKNHFEDKLVYNECFRSNTDRAIHFYDNLPFNKIKLAEQVLIDSFCLAKTNFKMICNSNVSTFSLLANYDKNNYIYLDKI